MDIKGIFRGQSFITLLLLLWLTACTPGSVMPTQPSPVTPTASPVAVPPTPVSLSPANVKFIVPFRRYGMGVPTDLAYAPDGSLIAVSTSIGIYRYDPQSFAELPLIETNAYVRSLAFSPDSHLIAAGEDNGGLRLWDARDGTLVRALKGHTGRVDRLAFSPDGQWLVSAAYNEEVEPHNSIVKIWRVEDGAPQARSLEFSRRPVEVGVLAFSPKGDLLAIGAANMVFIVASADWHVVHTIEGYDGTTDFLKGHDAPITDVTFSPDGEMLVTAAEDHTIQFWRTSNWKWVNQTISVPDERWVNDLFYSSDGKLLIGSGYPVRFWDAETRKLLDAPSISGDIALSPDGTSLAVLRDEVLELWRLSDFGLLHTWDGYTEGAYSLDVSPDGQVLAVGTFDGPARLLQVKDGSLVRTLPDAQMNVHFSPDGQTLLDVQDRVQFWDVRDGTLRDTYEWLSGTAESAAYSPDGRMLAVGLERDGAEVMKSSERAILFTLKWKTKYYNPIKTVIFSPDSRLLAAGDREAKVRLWNMEDGQPVSVFEGHTDEVEDLAFSPDGTVLASASLDKTVRLWRVEDGSLLKVLEHPGYVYDVAFSPDGQLLASACSDNTIKLWDMNGNLLTSLSAHTTVVSSVVFLPDGLSLASGSPDGTIWLWGLAP